MAEITKPIMLDQTGQDIAGKLDLIKTAIENQSGNVPIATRTTVGVMKPDGVDLDVDASGILSLGDSVERLLPIGVSNTARSSIAKTVTITGFKLIANAHIYVKFTDTGTANPTSGNITLNVNSTGAKQVVCYREGGNQYDVTYSNGSMFYNGSTLEFIYDGTNWIMYLGYNTDTRNTAGTSEKASTKLFLAGAQTQTNGVVTYSNAKCYIGTDNKLYSNGHAVVTDDVIANVINNSMANDSGVWGSSNGLATTLGLNENSTLQGVITAINNMTSTDFAKYFGDYYHVDITIYSNSNQLAYSKSLPIYDGAIVRITGSQNRGTITCSDYRSNKMFINHYLNSALGDWDEIALKSTVEQLVKSYGVEKLTLVSTYFSSNPLFWANKIGNFVFFSLRFTVANDIPTGWTTIISDMGETESMAIAPVSIFNSTNQSRIPNAVIQNRQLKIVSSTTTQIKKGDVIHISGMYSY